MGECLFKMMYDENLKNVNTFYFFLKKLHTIDSEMQRFVFQISQHDTYCPNLDEEFISLTLVVNLFQIYQHTVFVVSLRHNFGQLEHNLYSQ